MEMVVEMSPIAKAVAKRDDGVDYPGVVKVVVHIGDGAAVLWVHCEHLVEEREESWREILPHSGRAD